MLKYYIPDHGYTQEDAEEVPNCKESDPEDFAKIAADWCHARKDGWEWTWPVIFAVIDESGKEHRIEVSREIVPEFYIA
jgi:hypothetical protein